MSSFQLFPTDKPSSVAAIIAPDPAHLLRIVAGLPGREADVWRDGTYHMTIRLAGNGIWSIFERDAAKQASG